MENNEDAKKAVLSGNFSSSDFLKSIGVDPESCEYKERFKKSQEEAGRANQYIKELAAKRQTESELKVKAPRRPKKDKKMQKAILPKSPKGKGRKEDNTVKQAELFNVNNPETKKQVNFYFNLKNIAGSLKEKQETGLIDTLYLCPAGSFIEKTVNLFWNVTDIPLNMAFWSTLTILSGYLTQKGKKIRFETQTLFPALWNLTLAPSGAGKSIVLDFFEDNFKDKIKIDEPNYRSKAAVVADFLADPDIKCSVIKIDEMAQNIKLFRTESGQGLKEAYLTMYGGKLNHTTKEDGKIQITDIFVSIAAATALETFQDSIKPEDLFDGFLQRFLIIIGNKKERNMKNWPYLLKESAISEVKQSFEHYANRIDNIENFTVSKEAFKIWQKYYFDNFNPDLESHYKRYLWGTLKIAAIYNTFLEADGIISEADMSWALRIIEISLSNLYEVMDKYLAFDQWERLIQKIRIYIENHPGAEDRKILMDLHINKKMLEIAKQNIEDRNYKGLQPDFNLVK